MADGLTSIADESQGVEEIRSEQKSQLMRQKPLLIWAGFAFLGLISPIVYHFYVDQQFLASNRPKMLLTLASGFLWFPLIMLFRDSEDNFEHGPSWRLPAISMIILLLLTVGIVADSSMGHPFFSVVGEDRIWVIALFAMALFLVFGPPACNAVIYHKLREQAKLEKQAKTRNQDQNAAVSAMETRDAEAMSALITTVVIGTILCLAIFAGEKGEDLAVSSVIGIGLCGLVVTVFAAVVFSEPLSQLRVVKMMANGSKVFIALGRWLDWIYGGIDSFFVRIGSFIAGMEQGSIYARYSILAVSLVCICLMSWYLPAPLGMIPAAIGLFLAVSVSRLWSWAEHDRAMAVMTKFKKETPSRLDRKEDYRDETLLGFIFIFALMPIIMCQVHFGGVFSDEMFLVPAKEPRFLEWLAFFGVELAKAVPIVDWAEIYQIQEAQGSGQIQLNDKYSRHAVFLARATVDLVLIAALLQAVAIAGRNRQQKQLYRAGLEPSNRYKAGLIDRLDQFLEDAELKRAVKLTLRSDEQSILSASEIAPEVANKKHFDLTLLSDPEFIDFRRYNEERLYELFVETRDPLVKVFMKAIEHERPGFTLKSRLQLFDEYVEVGRPESDLYNLLGGLERDINSDVFEKASIFKTIEATLIKLRERPGLKDLKVKLLSFVPRLIPQVPIDDVMEMLADAAGLSEKIDFQYTRKRAIHELVRIAVSSQDVVHLKKCKALIVKISKKTKEPGMKWKIDEALKTLKAEISKFP